MGDTATGNWGSRELGRHIEQEQAKKDANARPAATVNGYSLADSYQILKQLLHNDDRRKQRGDGFLSGAEVAVIGGLMTELRLRDKAQAGAERAQTTKS